MADEPENDAENDPDSGGDPASGPDSGDDAGADAGASAQNDDSAEGGDGEGGADTDGNSDAGDADSEEDAASDPTDSDPTEDVGSEDENGASDADADEDSAPEDGGADEDSGDSGSDDSHSDDDNAAADDAADDSDAGEGGDGDADDDGADGSAGVASDDGTPPDDAVPPEGGSSTEAPEDGGATQVARTSPDQDHSNALVVNMWLRLRFRDPEDKPRVGLPYKLTVNGQTIEDKTDDEGMLIERVTLDQEDGTLEVEGQRITLKLYQLPPIEQISGVQARLNNLHYYCGEIDGQISLDMHEAIRRFQDDMACQGQPMDVTGEMDDATRDLLLKQHGA